MNITVRSYLKELNDAADFLDTEKCERAADLVLSTLLSGQTVFTCGNGGSGATASHYVNDWAKGISEISNRSCRAICLNDNMPSISAIANDTDYTKVFSFQLANLAMPGDLLVVISGSGNSKNILSAIMEAKRKGIKIVGVLGFDGGQALPMVDEVFWVPYNDMQIVEDLHATFGHIILKKAKKYGK